MNSTGQGSLLKPESIVVYDTNISIERLRMIEVVVKPEQSGTILIEEVKNEIIDLIVGNGDVISDVSIIEDGENGFIITVSVVDKDVENVVNALKDCMS